MTAFANAYVFRNATVKIAGTDYANQVSKVRLVPDTPIQTQRTLVPDGVIQDVDSTVWTLELTGVQAKVLTGSLWKALLDNAGLQTTLDFIPANGTGNAEATCTIIPVPADFGGDQGNINSFDISIPVLGAPTFAAAA